MATAPASDDLSESRSEPPRLAAWVESREGEPDTYTVAPEDASGVELMSRWISASVEVVCDLDEMR